MRLREQGHRPAGGDKRAEEIRDEHLDQGGGIVASSSPRHDDIGRDRRRDAGREDVARQHGAIDMAGGVTGQDDVDERDHQGGDEDERHGLDEDVEPPVEHVGNQFLSGNAETGDQEDDRHGAVQNTVLGVDDAAVARDVGEEVCQQAHNSHSDQEPLAQEEQENGLEEVSFATMMMTPAVTAMAHLENDKRAEDAQEGVSFLSLSERAEQGQIGVLRPAFHTDGNTIQPNGAGVLELYFIELIGERAGDKMAAGGSRLFVLPVCTPD